MDGQKIKTNGIELNVYDSGGDGEVIILTHGLTANMICWQGLLDAGLQDDFRLILVDLRGRGHSDQPKTGYHMEDHAQDILGLMDHYGIESAVIGGHSFGGLLTMYLCANYPERVKQMIIIDAGKEATDPSVLPKIKPSLDRLGKLVPSWEVYINAIKQSPYYADGFWEPNLEAYYQVDIETLDDGQVRSRIDPNAIQEAVEKIIALDWTDIIKRADRPALFLYSPEPFGPEGSPPVLSDDGAKETLDLLPNATEQKMTGHHITMLFGENAPRLAQYIKKYLQG